MPYLYVLHIQSNHQKEQQDHKKFNNNIPQFIITQCKCFSNVVVIVFFALAPNFNPTFSKSSFYRIKFKISCKFSSSLAKRPLSFCTINFFYRNFYYTTKIFYIPFKQR